MILVVGSTGSLGGQITRGLLGQDRPVRILVRPGSGYQPLVDAGAAPVIGDLKDRRSLDLGVSRHRHGDHHRDLARTRRRGHHRDGGPGGQPEPGRRRRRGRRPPLHLHVRARGRAGQPQSVHGREGARPRRRSGRPGMAWTILAPNAFMDVWLAAVVAGPALAGGEVVYVGSGARRHSFVHSRDVAAFALAAIDNPAAVNRYLPIGGPEPVSIRDAVDDLRARAWPTRFRSGAWPRARACPACRRSWPRCWRRRTPSTRRWRRRQRRRSSASTSPRWRNGRRRWCRSRWAEERPGNARGTPGGQPLDEAGWHRRAAHTPAAWTAPSRLARPTRSRGRSADDTTCRGARHRRASAGGVHHAGPAAATGRGRRLARRPGRSSRESSRRSRPGTTYDSFAESMAVDREGNLFASVTIWMRTGPRTSGRSGRSRRTAGCASSARSSTSGSCRASRSTRAGTSTRGLITFDRTTSRPGVLRIDRDGRATRVVTLARRQLPERAGVPWRRPLRLRQRTARSGEPVRAGSGNVTLTTPWLAGSAPRRRERRWLGGRQRDRVPG